MYLWNMKFRTEIEAVPFERSLTHEDPAIALGSCFAEHITQRLLDNKFHWISNPFGITYNPLSIARQLHQIRNHSTFNVGDVHKSGSHWISFDHHGRFNAPTAAETIEKISDELNRAQELNGQYRWTTLSLGTAWAWFKEGEVVNNCHQWPDSEFDFRLLTVDEMTEALRESLVRWNQANPDNITFITVSPVRHTRSGLIENNRSKARLIEVAHALVEELPFVFYYPSYELILDDLRDYRFYDQSLTHPSAEAIQYVWEHFSASFFSEHTTDTILAFERFRQQLWHRPRQTSGSGFTSHLQALEKKLDVWEQRWPYASWEIEKRRLNELMRMQ